MVIEYYVKNVYGREVMYPLNENMSRNISKLTGRKTLTVSDVKAFRCLGYSMVQVLPPTKCEHSDNEKDCLVCHPENIPW